MTKAHVFQSVRLLNIIFRKSTFSLNNIQQILDCRIFSLGTRTNVHAGYRACSCLPNFYRTDRFGKCFSCQTQGTHCEDDFLSLKKGFFWQWKESKEKDDYESFIENIKIKDDSYNRSTTLFNGSIPKPHVCPRPSSCLGGLDSKCSLGYVYTFQYTVVQLNGTLSFFHFKRQIYRNQFA